MRASIVARACFVEELVAERVARVGQFALLGTDSTRSRSADRMSRRSCPEDLVAPAREAGFSQARHIPATEPAARYFTDRPNQFGQAWTEAGKRATDGHPPHPLPALPNPLPHLGPAPSLILCRE
ncbi:hypothetical protein [Streptomyces sp. NPDC006012]|uniref:hypothetical protein n=1 Tax=Streptomyces sp. NPDC006012 TaxID=3364739 RepID=UPI0036AA1556